MVKISWFSKSRDYKRVTIYKNGGSISYTQFGKELEWGDKRSAVIDAEIAFHERLEEIFRGDPKIQITEEEA